MSPLASASGDPRPAVSAALSSAARRTTKELAAAATETRLACPVTYPIELTRTSLSAARATRAGVSNDAASAEQTMSQSSDQSSGDDPARRRRRRRAASQSCQTTAGQ